MSYDEWLKTCCFQKPTPEAYDLAKCAWNEAIKQAADKVDECFDEQEPWIESQDIRDLSA